MKSKPISTETKTAILEAVWRLIAEGGRAEVSQAEIAAAAGVSRQTVFYAFGSRAGLLTAALRHRDETLPFVRRFEEIRTGGPMTRERALEYLANWLDYLPHVYPAASLLHAAGLTDPEARAAIDDRLVHALLAGMRGVMRRLGREGLLPEGAVPEAVAEEIWAATHVECWRLLVVEAGWSPEAFRASRLALAARLIGASSTP